MQETIGVNQVKTIISETGIKTVQDFPRLGRDLDWTGIWYDTREGLTDLPDRQEKVGQLYHCSGRDRTRHLDSGSTGFRRPMSCGAN